MPPGELSFATDKSLKMPPSNRAGGQLPDD
jgi:hypothetical protein